MSCAGMDISSAFSGGSGQEIMLGTVEALVCLAIRGEHIL